VDKSLGLVDDDLLFEKDFVGIRLGYANQSIDHFSPPVNGSVAARLQSSGPATL
jgi:hypothetical protein